MNNDTSNKIEQISAQLTGNVKVDRPFLYENIVATSKQGKDEKYYLSFLTTMYYFFSDVDNIEQFKEVIALDKRPADSLAIALKHLSELNEGEKAIYLGMHAASEMETLIEKRELYPPLSGTDYRNFDSRIEEVLYYADNKANNQLIVAQTNYSRFYTVLVSLYLKANHASNAYKYALKALEWNPYSADAYLNLSKANNLLGDYNSAIEAALNAVKYAYKKPRIADAYRQISLNYTELGKYKIALAAQVISAYYDPSDDIENEIAALLKILNRNQIPPAEKLLKVLEEANIPHGYNDTLISAALMLGRRYNEQKNYELALKYLAIAYELGPLEEIKKLIDEVKAKIN